MYITNMDTSRLIKNQLIAKCEEISHHQRKDSDYHNLDADKVLSAFGTFGRYQMLTYIATNFIHIIFAINMMIMPFITEAPSFDCQITTAETMISEYTKIDNCTILDETNRTLQCNSIPNARFVYDFEPDRKTLVTEFDLVCEKESLSDHGSSIFLLGTMIGSPLLSQLSDLLGRRVMYLIPLYISVISNLLCAISPNYVMFLAFRFISGIAASGAYAIGFILCMESVSTKFRDYIPIMGNFLWLIGYMLAGVLSMFIRDWRWLYFAITIPGMLTIPFYWCLPESLHWMITKRNTIAVKKYIRTSSRFNNASIALSECESETSLETIEEEPQRTFLDILRCAPLLIHMIITAYATITMNMTYWALSLFSTELSEHKMLGFFLSGIVEFPAALVALFVMKYFQRRWVTFFSLFFQSIALLCAIYIPLSPNILIVFPLIAKSCNVVIWSVQPLHSTESVPTTVRNVFAGFANFIGDLGSVVAPYIRHLEVINANAPFLLIAIMSSSSAILTLTMPETKNKRLPEDIGDFKPGPFWNKIFKNNQSNFKSKSSQKIGIAHNDGKNNLLESR